MARMPVVQIRCDRCKRVELVPPVENKSRPDFEARLMDTKLVFEDLCQRCKVSLENAWKDLQEWNRELNQPFGPSAPVEKAVPLQPAPDYSPPKPHSVAAGQKK